MNKQRDIVDQIIDYEDGMMDEEERITFFQGLIDSGTIHGLQGSYGRTAKALEDAGLVHGFTKIKTV